MQAQYSTTEQLDNLRILASANGIPFDDPTPKDRMLLISLANKNGLYDAADHLTLHQK